MTGLYSLEESNEGAFFTVEKLAIDCFDNVRKFTLRVHPNTEFKFARHLAAFQSPAMFTRKTRASSLSSA